MAISRRLEGLRSSRLDHSMQNFTPELLESLPRPDSLDLEGKITKNWGRDRRRRAKSPKAEKLAGVARGSHGVPRGSHGVPHQMLKSVARLGATLLSICAELRALRREASAFESFAKLKLCARLGAQRVIKGKEIKGKVNFGQLTNIYQN